jgi:hypothetical protein
MLDQHRAHRRNVDDLAALESLTGAGVAEHSPATRTMIGKVLDDLVGCRRHLQGLARSAALLAPPPFAATRRFGLGFAFGGLALAFAAVSRNGGLPELPKFWPSWRSSSATRALSSRTSSWSRVIVLACSTTSAASSS